MSIPQDTKRHEALRFVIQKNAKGEWYWILKAANGETIATSLGEGYHNLQDCKHAIDLIQKYAAVAPCVVVE